MKNTYRSYLIRQKRKRRSILAAQIGILFVFFGLWEVGARLNWFDPFILSSPSRILETILRLYRSHELWLHIYTTLCETVLGFLFGTALGTLIAVVLWWIPSLNRILDPYLVVLNALPKIALGPVLIVWIGAGMESIVVMGILVSLVVTTVTVLNGFLTTTDEKQLLMKTLGANRRQIFFKVVLPAGGKDLIAALKISVGMSWVGVIVGEYLVSKAGLGYLIVYGGQVFKLDLVMASVVILCVLAALMYYAVALLEKRVLKGRA